MKLTQLIADYLYSHKRLDLEGIGTFMLDSSLIHEADDSKESKNPVPGIISFEKNISVKNDSGLIRYISEQTGKMTALASSDLDSYLQQAKQFLNIGKPFLFEGIGTLAKNKDEQYQFTQGNIFIEKIKANAEREIIPGEETPLDYKSIFMKGPKKINWRKPVLALFLLAGLAVVIGGGYWLYKKTSEKETEANTETPPVNTDKEPGNNPDSLQRVPDSASQNTQTANSPLASSGNFKFVLDQFQAPRAFKRFAQLKSNGWNIQMETKDSVSYKLFVQFPVQAMDTTRVIDSLTALNGRRVYIEHNN